MKIIIQVRIDGESNLYTKDEENGKLLEIFAYPTIGYALSIHTNKLRNMSEILNY